MYPQARRTNVPRCRSCSRRRSCRQVHPRTQWHLQQQERGATIKPHLHYNEDTQRGTDRHRRRQRCRRHSAAASRWEATTAACRCSGCTPTSVGRCRRAPHRWRRGATTRLRGGRRGRGVSMRAATVSRSTAVVTHNNASTPEERKSAARATLSARQAFECGRQG
jgi:hypothetical protein